MISEACYDQSAYQISLKWGQRGAADSARRTGIHQKIVVIVDVLSFSSAVVTAVHFGGSVIPCRNEAEAKIIVQARNDATVLVAVKRELAVPGEFSISPVSFMSLPAGFTIVLPTLNGANCSLVAASDSTVVVGCLLNAKAVANYINNQLSQNPDIDITILACGERWERPHPEGDLRFAIEDYIGAGAILSELQALRWKTETAPFSPEAKLCAEAFRSLDSNSKSQVRLKELLLNCGSGRELINRGYMQDVQHASMLNSYNSVPILRGDTFKTVV